MTAISALPPARMAMHNRRKRVNVIALSLAFGAMAFGVFWLVWILIETVRLGGGGLNLALFTESTPAAMSDGGGLANALYGSALMVLVATFIGTPIGIFSGVYLAEYGQKSWLASTTRFINDILLSAPSIVIGLFVYELIVVPTRAFSGWAGSVALALIVIPVVIRTTENMLNLVPHALREAAYALGTPKWKVISSVTLTAARSGVITGILLAIARIVGETAPLLFTALSNQFFSTSLAKPLSSVPMVIFNFAMQPYPNLQRIAWAGVFLITLGVLALNIAARVFFRNKN
ncbi:MAG TPA: phosphate ABC transporter permease PstA [Burkholderiaceae bacterium]